MCIAQSAFPTMRGISERMTSSISHMFQVRMREAFLDIDTSGDSRLDKLETLAMFKESESHLGPVSYRLLATRYGATWCNPNKVMAQRDTMLLKLIANCFVKSISNLVLTPCSHVTERHLARRTAASVSAAAAPKLYFV